MEIVEINSDDWNVFRDVRLRAVKDCPQAFALSEKELVVKTEEYWSRAFLNSKNFIAEQDGNEIGSIRLFKDVDGTWSVGSMWVEDGSRNKGVGYKLLLQVLHTAEEMKIQYLELGVNSVLNDAISLYRRIGFKEVKIIKNVQYGDGNSYDELIMGFNVNDIAE